MLHVCMASQARHVTSIPMRALATLGTDGIFTAAGLHEFMPSVRFASWLEGHLCTVRPELCVRWVGCKATPCHNTDTMQPGLCVRSVGNPSCWGAPHPEA